jgi:phosphopantothenoylcysteine decarboxylase / phosphopantothenate---cysteine ligase
MVKNILLGVTGGIAGYKAPLIVRLLKKQGFNVKVILTENGSRFVSELSLATVSEENVYQGLFDHKSNSIDHIDIATWADIFVIAPATANVIAKMANGIGDDLLTTVVLATKAKLLIAPGMNNNMWENQATIENVNILSKRGVKFIGPDSGFLACGTYGSGRMSQPEKIVDLISSISEENGLLKGKHILITAGATREYLDPVRFISNPSSGKMGKALCEKVLEMGGEVTYVTGFVESEIPMGVNHFPITNAKEMERVVLREYEKCQMVIMAAAVGDWSSNVVSQEKLKKEDVGDTWNIQLKRTRDILATLGGLIKSIKNPPLLVGFSAETKSKDELIKTAREKMERKGCDFIIANDVSRSDTGFGAKENEVIILGKNGFEKFMEKSPKPSIAQEILLVLSGHLN